MRSLTFHLVSTVLLLALLCTSACSRIIPPSRESTADLFMLHDGDRVVFLGDSITAARTYGEIVERYTLAAYPHRRIQFINAGIGGDTAQGGLKRLESTVLVHKPTVVTICYGINDIGWGTRATPENIQQYYNGMREITRRCQQAGARVFVLGPCATKLGENENPNEENKSPLAQMSAHVRKTAAGMGATPIDLYGEFRKIEWVIRQSGREKDSQTHAPDGVHLSELGNLIFGYILLKGMGAPDSVSDLTIDASVPSVISARRCEVSNLCREGDVLRFTRIDQGWPLHLGTFAWINFGFVPTHEKLARYTLRVTGLPSTSQSYKIRLNGEDLSTVTLQNLKESVNLAYMTPQPFADFPPWRVQSSSLEALTRARTQLDQSLPSDANIVPQDLKVSKKLAADTARQIKELEVLQHEVAEPRTLRFEIIPIAAPPPMKK